jgi:hypothetical protein
MNKLTQEIVNFLYDNGSKYSNWSVDELQQYVDFYFKLGAMGIIREKGEIVGVGMARPIDLLQFHDQAANRWHFSAGGDVLFIQEVCATKKRAIPRLWDLMIERFGIKQFAAGKRHEKFRIWNFNKYQERVFKLEGKL